MTDAESRSFLFLLVGNYFFTLLIIGLVAALVSLPVVAYKASLPFRVATFIPPAAFSLGAAGGHIYQMITAHNFSPGNVGLVLPSNFLIPVVGFVFLWLSYKHPRSEVANQKLI